MTSYEMISKIGELREPFGEVDSLLSALSMLDKAHAELKPSLNEVLAKRDPNAAWVHLDGLRRRLDQITADCKSTIRPATLFYQVRHLERDLRQVLGSFPSADKEPLKELQSLLEKFSGAYEAFIRDYSYTEEIQMLASATALQSTVNAVLNMFSFVTDNLQQQPLALRGDQAELSIFLDTDVNLADLAAKLSAIHALYQEACELLNISTVQQPLEIIKVETGSAWLKVLGSKTGVTVMRKWIEAAASYVYRNYTKEGKLVTIPRDIETIAGVLQLREMLKEAGLDPSAMNEHIQKAATSVAHNLNDLLAGEPSVVVDGKTYSISAESRQKLLAERKTRLLKEANGVPRLEDGSNQNPNPPPPE